MTIRYYKDLTDSEKAHVDSLAESLHIYAKEHYNEGWDTFVECGLEYCRESVTINCTNYYDDSFTETTFEKVIESAKCVVDVLDDQRADAEYHIRSSM